jgi:hypothetical protein
MKCDHADPMKMEAAQKWANSPLAGGDDRLPDRDVAVLHIIKRL